MKELNFDVSTEIFDIGFSNSSLLESKSSIITYYETIFSSFVEINCLYLKDTTFYKIMWCLQ